MYLWGKSSLPDTEVMNKLSGNHQFRSGGDSQHKHGHTRTRATPHTPLLAVNGKRSTQRINPVLAEPCCVSSNTDFPTTVSIDRALTLLPVTSLDRALALLPVVSLDWALSLPPTASLNRALTLSPTVSYDRALSQLLQHH